ncbi:hypothetical protein AJ80_05283 [Polytolypa hystricis UAMH7299]|uniref:Aminoglycoside phosphotransferase domain-containing protein n=1 Tax=Polytolypa hystricis (strain UAMH7299) TaxID=1447883 RepID=A0A2B7Y4U5_POLH7|nr:hypothetical protein AJ80_05283 [Polytolypa hystricis UAMH7299]
MLNARREENCVGVTPERKYYKVGQTFIKRSLRPSEWQTNHYTGSLFVPRFGKERIQNEAASIKFIAKNTNILVPELYCCFEDYEAVYLIMQGVEGVVPPHRVMTKSVRPQWNMKPLESEGLVFCHNDLSAYNVIVDTETLKVKAIIDWEYAGFYPRIV